MNIVNGGEGGTGTRIEATGGGVVVMSMPATSSMPVVGVVVAMSMLAQGSRFPRVCVRCAMPLSQAQVDILKTPTTVIEIQRQNPKKPGSKSFERFMLQPKAPTGRICRQTLKKVT